MHTTTPIKKLLVTWKSPWVEEGSSLGCIKYTHLLILLCILSDPRCHPVASISSIPSRNRQRRHVTHELHAVAYADDWPPTIKLIPRVSIPNRVSATLPCSQACRRRGVAHVHTRQRDERASSNILISSSTTISRLDEFHGGRAGFGLCFKRRACSVQKAVMSFGEGARRGVASSGHSSVELFRSANCRFLLDTSAAA